MKKFLVLHGINLNMFGKRDPKPYGTLTLAQLAAQVQALGRELGSGVECFETSFEGAMCERIHRVKSAHHLRWVLPLDQFRA